MKLTKLIKKTELWVKAQYPELFDVEKPENGGDLKCQG